MADRPNVDAFMPLWIADYVADTSHLTTLQHGVYFLLLMAYWRNGGPLRDDDKRFSAITKMTPKVWAKVRPVVAEFFTVEDGMWSQKRADAEIAKALNMKELQRQRTEAATRARMAALANVTSNVTSDVTSDVTKSPSPTPSPVSIEINPDTPVERASAPRRGHRIPDGWRPDDDGWAFAVAKGLTPDRIDRTVEEFVDYWANVPGSKGCKLDWGLTWKNRIRQMVENGWGVKPAAAANGPPAEKRIWSKNGIPYVWCEFTNDWIQDIGLG